MRFDLDIHCVGEIRKARERKGIHARNVKDRTPYLSLTYLQSEHKKIRR
jgi:hypothetical protein